MKRAQLESALARLDQVAERLRTADERGKAQAVDLAGADVDSYLRGYLGGQVTAAADDLKAIADSLRPRRT